MSDAYFNNCMGWFKMGAMRASCVLFSVCVGCATPTGNDPSHGGTGGDTEEAMWRRICDGSTELRLAARTVGSEGGETSIASEIGHWYLYVRGDCRYWAIGVYSSDLGMWKVAHTGTMTTAVEEQLSRELVYGRWSELAGFYPNPSNPGGYESQYSDGTSSIRCELNCSISVNAPQELKDLTPVVNQWTQRLWDEGAPLEATAPMRVDVLRLVQSEPVNDNPCVLEWPFALDPQSLSRDIDESPGFSRLVSDEAAASQLRSLRAQYVADELPEGTCNPVIGDGSLQFYEATDPTIEFTLWMRDHIPLEYPEGGIPLPMVP